MSDASLTRANTTIVEIVLYLMTDKEFYNPANPSYNRIAITDFDSRRFYWYKYDIVIIATT